MLKFSRYEMILCYEALKRDKIFYQKKIDAMRNDVRLKHKITIAETLEAYDKAINDLHNNLNGGSK